MTALSPELREKIARELADKFGGWANWDSQQIASGPNGNDPEEERTYWRDVVDFVIASAPDEVEALLAAGPAPR